LTCPSDEPQISSGESGTHPGSTFHNYVANYGNTNHIGWDHRGPASPAYVKYLGSPFTGNDWNLPVPAEDITKFSEIQDGLSKTLLASETVQGREGDLRGYTWWGWSAGFETLMTPNGSDPDRLYGASYCKPIPPNPPCSPATAADYYMGAARSRHTGGVNAAMCDGSVMFVIDNIDLAVWRAAGTIEGDEAYGSLPQ
jgi:prepilin-type processing-associated H-X9-DG protein